MTDERDTVRPAEDEAGPGLGMRERAAAAVAESVRVAARTLTAAGVEGVHRIMPLLAAYAGREPAAAEDLEAADIQRMAMTGEDTVAAAEDAVAGPQAKAGSSGFRRLSSEERAVVGAAATRAFGELLEITSRTSPAYKDATPYQAYSDGVFQRPHLMHVLSLGVAASRLIESRTKAEPPPVEPAQTQQGVAYLAVAPGEYQEVSGPLTPTDIRRSAMRQRSYSQPQLAMMAKQSNQFQTAPAGMQRQSSQAMMMSGAAQGASRGAGQGAMMVQGKAQYVSAGKGCGCGCGCGGNGASRQFQPARRDADGKCVSIARISCETQWGVRDCLKWAVCDLLRCFGEELCDEDGRFARDASGDVEMDLSACLERFVCSIVTCLPEAICPPPPRTEGCCVEVIDCDCNFAVGE